MATSKGSSNVDIIYTRLGKRVLILIYFYQDFFIAQLMITYKQMTENKYQQTA